MSGTKGAFWSALLLVVLLVFPASALAQVGQSRELHYATIHGKASVQFGARMYPAGNTPVYLFTLDQSARVRQLEREAYKRSHKTGATEDEASRIVGELVDTLDKIIPKLPRTAITRTNRKGFYRFERIPPATRYHVIAFGQWEDGNYIAARITPLIKEGEKLELDLRDDTPWEEQFLVK